MNTAHTAAAPLGGVSAARTDAVSDTPRWLDTYALTYALGVVWLAIAMLALGSLPRFAFDGAYDALLILPPVATALCVLLVDRHGSMRSLPLRAVVLAMVAGIVSVLSTVLLTPLLAIMFRERVGWNLGATGLISTVTLLVVASPMVPVLIASVKRRRIGRALVIVAGLALAGVALAMALAPAGPVASLMRLDQAEITMITVSWWLPFYAATAGFVRRLGLA